MQACVPALLGCLESSCSSLERHSGCSIGSQVLDVVVFSLFLFSYFFKPYLFGVRKQGTNP